MENSFKPQALRLQWKIKQECKRRGYGDGGDKGIREEKKEI